MSTEDSDTEDENDKISTGQPTEDSEEDDACSLEDDLDGYVVF